MLPFTTYADIESQGGDTLAEDVPVRLEYQGNSPNRVGEQYDWICDCHVSAAEYLLGATNSRLVHDGRNFKVVSAELHDFIPHLTLTLKEVRGG